MANPDTDGLKIGDLITLKSPKWESYLGAEGILLHDLIVKEALQEFDDCIFSVHLQRQYSASRELESFLETYNVDENAIKDESMKQYLKALQKGRDNEVKLNNMYMKNKAGMPIAFGDVIQLFHVKSKKYLIVNPKQLANAERENSKVSLNSSGNIHSWVQFMPRFKIDREGDRILTSSELFIRISERSNEFVHCADKSPKEGQKREVNCSLENTSWKITIFSSCFDEAELSIVLANRLVYIHDPETRSNLTVATKQIESFDEDPFLSEDSPFYHEFGDIVSIPMGEVLDLRCIWSIETKSLTSGGPIQWKTDQVRFKNLALGLFLAFIKYDGEDEFRLSVTYDVSNPGTLFNIHELNSSKNQLSLSKALQIAQDALYLERGEEIDDKKFIIKSTKDKTEAVSLLINGYKQFTLEEDEGAGDSPEPLDVYSGMSTGYYIRKYLDMTVIPRQRGVNTLWPSGERTEMEFFHEFITKAKNFSQGFMVSDENITLGVDKSNHLLRIQRQKMFCELGILESTLRFVNRLKPITELFDRSVKSGNPLTETEKALLEMGNNILAECLDLVYYCILDCPDNQMYVADFLPDLLAHLSSQPLAGKCVTAMLSTNMELQETKIGAREISIFVEKLRNSKMNSMYLNLLQSCCSCQGQGVDANQCKVAEMLFDDPTGIIVEMKANQEKLTREKWNVDDSIYIPRDRSKLIEGVTLLFEGSPELTLSWTGTEDYSPQALFNSSSVSIFDMYPVDLNFKSKGDLEKKRIAVANYFIHEMYLGAEMCMDRNYVAMHKLDPLFGFEPLVAIMKANVNNKLKAAACRLLFCLHVDRDPQAGTKIPCLTRTWHEIEINEIPQLPFVGDERQYVYSLIQQLCSEHIQLMSGSKWDELAQSVLQMVLGLIKFNFYGTVDKMTDVIGPIISAVDRRKVLYSDPKKEKGPESSSSSSSSSEKATKENPDDDFIEMDSEEKKAADAIANSWQKAQYNFLEGLPAMCAILVLVLVAVGVTIYQVVSGLDETSEFFYFGLVVLAIFLYDFFMRFYCYYHINGVITPFLKDPFNIIDQIVILIDVVFLVLPSDVGGSGTSFTKTLRLIRLVRLVRVLRAAKVINAFSKQKKEIVKWNPPARYTKCPVFELVTMTEAINVLLFVQGVIADRNLSILLRYFYLWEAGTETRSPSEIFDQVCEDSQEVTLDIMDMNAVLSDCLMFVHPELVQGSLNVLMAHHSMRDELLKNAKDVQLLVNPKRQKEFAIIRNQTIILEQNAETHELWGELATDDDQAYNKKTKEILHELIKAVRVRKYTLEFDRDFQPVREIQDLLRNLGLFEISLKVLGLLDSVEEDEDGELDDVAKNTQELCSLCNELLYWFTLGNPVNQEIVFEELDFFLDSLDAGISSHKVVKAVFKDNETLMKLVPHSYLSDMADKICQEGKSHHYLALASSITHVGEKNITQNQFEIIRSLCNPERMDQVSCFLVPTDHPDYQEKIELMSPFKDSRDIDVDSLPPLLAYHLTFLEVLSNCTTGKINISAVEAKVQSIFALGDIIEAILDPEAILVTKIRLSEYLLNAVIDVEMALPGLCESRHMWNLIESFIPLLSYAKDEVRSVEKLGWESQDVSRHRIEYIMLCIMIIGAFFGKNYDASKLRVDDGTSNADRVNISMGRVNDIIVTLFNSIFECYDLDTPRLTTEMKGQMYEAITALNKSATNVIVSSIEPIHIKSAGADEEEKDPDEIHELEILGKYKEFMRELTGDEDVLASAAAEINGFIDLFEGLDSIYDRNSNMAMRYEPFVQKLVAHVRQNMSTDAVDKSKSLNAECTSTTKWMIKSFRTQIENKMEMTIEERDDDGGDEEDEKAGPTVTALNDNGVTGLCLELIAPGIDEELQSEVIKLLVGMLFKEGGARLVQGTIYNYLTKNDSELFFRQVRATIQKLIAWHDWNGIIVLEEDEEPEPPEDILIIRFLQLLAEGHYLPNQEIMREQPNNHVQINLLDDFVNYYNVLSRLPCQTSTNAAIRVGATIVEVIQGPCTGNQTHFAMSTELLEIQNRIMRSKCLNDCVDEEECELKMTCLDTISALLEGQTPKDQVTVRILSVVHIDIFQTLAKPFVQEAEEGEEEENMEGPSEDQLSLQTECIVLLQMLCDYKPSLKKDFEDDEFELDESSTASVEIAWDGILNRRFFHVPEVCYLLAKSSKDRLVQDVDRSNSENKLLDFLDKAKNLYREIKHQEFLTEKGVANIFSPSVHNNATWLSFFFAVIINVMFVSYYDATGAEEILSPQHAPAIPDDARLIVTILNYLQIVTSVFTIILTFVVRSPVIAWGLQEDPDIKSQWEVLLYTALDPMTLYYIWYLLFACLGAFHHDMFITFLLLDLIVKNPTTADILNAVVIPRAQLIVAFILGAFTIYIYTFFIFIFYPYRITSDDDGTPGGSDEMDCVTLWGCYKYVFAYGFRAGGGVGDVMYHDVGNAAWLHMTFFLIVTIAMLNIIFGIIIDTFSGLRSEKNDRNYDTTETCFICSIPRQTFDRAANSPTGFKNHIKYDHHMWNYLNFIFFLWEQDKDDDDGLEYYVRHKIILNEITWFPMNKAMCLDLGETDLEIMRGKIFGDISNNEKQLLNKISDLQADSEAVLEKISSAIEQDYKGGSIKMGIADYLSKILLQGDEMPMEADDQNVEQDMIGDDSTIQSFGTLPPQVKLCASLHSVRMPQLIYKEELMELDVKIVGLNGEVIDDKAIDADVKTKSIFFQPNPLTIVEDINLINLEEIGEKNVMLQILEGDLMLCEVYITVKEIFDHQGKNFEKVFHVGEVACSATLNCTTLQNHHIMDKDGSMATGDVVQDRNGIDM